MCVCATCRATLDPSCLLAWFIIPAHYATPLCTPDSGDDLLTLSIIDGVLASLRLDACEPRSAAAQPRRLLPLPLLQLVLLLWHSLSRVARGSFVAKTAAAICDAIEARPDARCVALLTLLHYSFRHFEQVPQHLVSQFQTYLIAAPGADGPTAAVTFDASHQADGGR